MRFNIYSIYDVAAAMYQRPFVAHSHGEVTRTFMDVASDKNHEIGKHPEDYTMFCVGQFNDQTAEIIPYNPEKVATALELVAVADNVKADNGEPFE